ncbi:MAG: class I SAM-dependent methyltransferase [Planctomycetota bacterium]
MSEIDFGRTASDYRKHRPGFPPSLLDRVSTRWSVKNGQAVLDVGTGTGTLGRLFAERGAKVVGLDRSPELLEQARQIDRDCGIEGTRYVVGTAEETGQESGAFDWVAAGQCWHWFDRHKASEEARRLLKPGGHLLIAHFDWLPLPGNVVAATEALILSFNPNWSMHGGTGIYAAWPLDVRVAGFEDLEIFTYDTWVPFSHEAWRGRIRASAGVGASLPKEEIERFDEAHAALLKKDFGDDPLEIPHRVFALTAQSPG